VAHYEDTYRQAGMLLISCGSVVTKSPLQKKIQN
jgi:hypothetical protein